MFGTVSINGMETDIQVQREVDGNGNLTGGFVPASQEDADNLSAMLGTDIDTDTTLGTPDLMSADSSSQSTDNGRYSVTTVVNTEITGSNLTGPTGTATLVEDGADTGEPVYVQWDQHGNVIDVSYEPDFDEPATGIEPLNSDPSATAVDTDPLDNTPTDVDPLQTTQTPASGTNAAPGSQSDAAGGNTAPMNVAEDIGSGSSATPANPPTSPGTPLGTPLDEPAGASSTVFPIAEPISSSTSGDHNAEDHHDEIPGSAGFPVAENEPGAIVYQQSFPDALIAAGELPVIEVNADGELEQIAANQQAHHIVPQGDARADKIRKLLTELGIDIHDPANGIFLPASADPDISPNPEGRTTHNLTMTDAYFDYLKEMFKGVTTREEALRVLEQIRTALENGWHPDLPND